MYLASIGMFIYKAISVRVVCIYEQCSPLVTCIVHVEGFGSEFREAAFTSEFVYAGSFFFM